MQLGDRIRQLRIEHDMLQKDFANQLNLSQQTISLYESNNRQPDYTTLKTIATVFNVSTDYLLGLTNIKAPLYATIEDPSEILKELNKLSPRNQEEIFKLVKMYRLWEGNYKGINP